MAKKIDIKKGFLLSLFVMLFAFACKNNKMERGEELNGIIFTPSSISFRGYTVDAEMQVRVANFEHFEVTIDSVHYGDSGYTITNLELPYPLRPFGSFVMNVALSLEQFGGSDTSRIELFLSSSEDTLTNSFLVQGPRKMVDRLLSNTDFSETPVAFSPDEKQLLFLSDQEGGQNVFLMNVDGLGRKKLNTVPGKYGAAGFSENGEMVVYYSQRDTTTTIYGYQLQEQTETVLLEWQGYNIPVAVSNNGMRVVYNKFVNNQYDIYLLDTEAGRSTVISNNPDLDEIAVLFEKGDERILYYEVANDVSQMYKIRVSGTDRRRISDTEGSDVPFATTEDGSYIVFFTERGNRREVFLVDWDGNEQLQTTSNDRLDIPADVNSRIGKVLYLSSINGNYEIYESNYDGRYETRLTTSSLQDYPVSYSKSGGYILYYNDNRGKNQIRLIDLRSLR